MQDALLQAYGALNRFRGESSLFTWLYRIVVNQAHNHYRKESRRQLPSLEGSHIDPADQVSGIAEYFEQNEEFTTLMSALQELEQAFREIVILHYFDGLSYEEIAEYLQIKQGTVKSRLNKARELLRRILNTRGTGEDFFG